MKITIFLMIAFCMQVSAEGYSQKITISEKNAPMQKVFKEIEKQSGYVFWYESSLIASNSRVNLSVKNAELKDVLELCFTNQPLTYSILGKTIVLKEKPLPIVNESVKQSEESTVPPIAVRGKVTDENGKPLAGVSIRVKNDSKGTATQDDGSFLIEGVKEDAVLILSGANVETKEIKINGRVNIGTIQLNPKVISSEEIVVDINTGYQEIKKIRMTGSVESIEAKDIANKGYTSVEEILKGQMSGVAAMSLSGRPGAQAQIRIRGINSLSGNSNPIWIVDGMPLQGEVPSISMGGTEFEETVLTSGIGNIAPDDIESITVLKDAAASAIYGARAANGVIVVKTKRGTAGKSSINIQSSYAISEAPKNRLVMMNSPEKIAFERGIYEDFPGLNLGGRVYQLLKNRDNGKITNEEAEQEINRLGSVNTNWFDEIFRQGQTQNHSVSLSGGNERTQYYGSLSYLGQNGVMPNNKYENKGANLNITHNFNEKLRIYFNANSSVRDDRSSASRVNPLNYATYANPYEQLKDQNGEYAFDRSFYPDLSTIQDGYKYDFNILKDLNDNTVNSKYLSNRTSLKLEYRIISGLMFSSMGTYSNSNTHTMSELIPGSFSSKSNSWVNRIYNENEVPSYLNNGKISESTSRSESWTIRNQLEFAKGLSHGDHYINALVGQEVSSQTGYGFSSMIPEWDPMYGVASYPDLNGIPITSDVNFSSLGSHRETQDRSVSMFATGSYSYKDRYIAAASARMDGVDIIGTANRFSPLWNVSGRWNLHKESFLESHPFINLLSIRASYGFTGSIDRSVLPFSIMAKRENYVYDGQPILDRFSPASPPVKWQKKEDRNFGFDASLFDYRVNLTINYYNNDVRDLIGTNRIAASTGRSSVVSNVASLNNTGWEFSLRTLNVKTKNVSWTTSFNITTNKSIVTETLLKNLSDYSINSNSTFDDIYNLYIQGEPVKAYYGYSYAGVDPYDGGTLAYIDGVDSKGEPLGSLNEEGRYVYNMDQNSTAETLHASRGYLGLSYPPVTGGFGTQLNYKRISLSTRFTFMTGHLIKSFQSYTSGGNVNASAKNVLAIEANRWRTPGDITDIPRYRNGRTEYLYQLYDFRFEDGSYLKCNNISVGYNLEQNILNKLNLQRARINFNLSNPFTLTKYRGIDPETMGAFGYPSAKVYNLSISLGL